MEARSITELPMGIEPTFPSLRTRLPSPVSRRERACCACVAGETNALRAFVPWAAPARGRAFARGGVGWAGEDDDQGDHIRTNYRPHRPRSQTRNLVTCPFPA